MKEHYSISDNFRLFFWGFEQWDSIIFCSLPAFNLFCLKETKKDFRLSSAALLHLSFIHLLLKGRGRYLIIIRTLIFKNHFASQQFFFIFAAQIKTVVVAQLVRASDCDSEGRGFEPPRLPTKNLSNFERFFNFMIAK